MADLLHRHTPSIQQMWDIAEVSAAWIVEAKAKVAMKLWAMNVLTQLRVHLP